jgi:hypothetical protein
VQQWDARNFPVPAKPAVTLIRGAAGPTLTAGQVAYVRTQLYRALQACRNDLPMEAQKRLDSIRIMLSRGQMRDIEAKD